MKRSYNKKSPKRRLKKSRGSLKRSHKKRSRSPPMMALHTRFAPIQRIYKQEITSSDMLMLSPTQGIGSLLKKASSGISSATSKVIELKTKAESIAKQASEKSKMLQEQATQLADKAVKVTEEIQQKADQIQQATAQVQQQYSDAKQTVEKIGQTLTTLPPSVAPAVVATDIKQVVSPAQRLRKYKYF